MVQRYILDRIAEDMCEYTEGAFVKYEDYMALKEKADRLAGELDKFLSGERAFLESALYAYRIAEATNRGVN